MRFRRHQEAARGQTHRLLLLFALVVLAMVVGVNLALMLAWHLTLPMAHGYPPLFFETNTGMVLFVVLGGCWFEQWRLQEGGAHVARMAGGQPAIGPGGQPNGPLEKRLLNVVQEMALASGMRAPQAWVLPRDDSINAFAAGWDEHDAVIGVTRGALERLAREELQGVIAHECSHLAHGDTRLNMRLIGMVWGLSMLFGFGHSLALPGEDRRLHLGTLFGCALMAVGSLGWLGGRLLQAAVSRQREFLADAAAVQYTRNPAGLGGALRKIAGAESRRQRALRAPHAAAIAHLLLDAPGTSWWASHPPLAERIRRLLGRALPGLPAPTLTLASDAEDEPDVPPLADAPRAAHAPAALASLMPKSTAALEARSPRRAAAGAAVMSSLSAARARSGAVALGAQPPAAGGGIVTLGDRPDANDSTDFDATQDARWHGAAEHEREALARIGRWAGPGERRAALLALLLQPTPARQLAWQHATEGLACAPMVWDDLALLGPAARRETLVALARRSRELAGRAERLALRAELQAFAQGPTEQLRALAMRHLLDARPSRWGRAERRHHLRPLAPAIAIASSALARSLGLTGRDATDWSATVLGLLGIAGRQRPEDRTGATLRRALARLRRLAPLERPRLARAWLDASAARLAHTDSGPATGEMLQLACLLLDTPAPPGLERAAV